MLAFNTLAQDAGHCGQAMMRLWGRRGDEGHTRDEEKEMWRQRQRLGQCGHKPKNARRCQELEEAGSPSSGAFRGSVALTTP